MSKQFQNSTHMEAFTFGDPEPVLGGPDILQYLEAYVQGLWYAPPVSFDDLARLLRANPHHESAIRCKVNILASTFVPHPWLSREDFKAAAFDDAVFGNAYLEVIPDRSGGVHRLRHALAKYMRRGVRLDQYFFLQNHAQVHEFRPGSVLHVREPDINQEVYGLPQYLSALQSAQLGESATLFRRRYYNNGSHAGFILYISDAIHQQEDVDAIRETLKKSKGVGNFRNLFLYAPGGSGGGVKLIPISEVAAKDEFLNIKNASRDDVLAAHRVPPQLMGVVPNNTGGFGDVEKAALVFARNEIEPLQQRFLGINDALGMEVVRFTRYELPGGGGVPSP